MSAEIPACSLSRKNKTRGVWYWYGQHGGFTSLRTCLFAQACCNHQQRSKGQQKEPQTSKFGLLGQVGS